MSNFWQDENEEEFRDIPDEVTVDANGRPLDAPPAQVNSTSRPAPVKTHAHILGETIQKNTDVAYEDAKADHQIDSEEDEDFSTVLSDARLRLEQGRLYEMIMNNDLFEGTDADPVAVKHVQKQIRNFAKERMEVMLGMRQEASQEPSMSAASFPFNDLEVEALKALASTATRGATKAPEAQQFTAAATPQGRMGLKPISLKGLGRTAPKVQAPAAKPLAQKPTTPVTKNKRTEAQIEQILAEEGISREEYERQYNPSYKPLQKPVSQMNEQELKEWKRQDALKTNKQVKSAGAIPMPSPAQEEMLHTQRAQTAAAHPQMQTIMNLLMNPKKPTNP